MFKWVVVLAMIQGGHLSFAEYMGDHLVDQAACERDLVKIVDKYLSLGYKAEDMMGYCYLKPVDR